MNANELRDLMQNREAVATDPFAVLQELSAHLNSDRNENVGRDLLLRALKWRDAFEPYVEILDSLSRSVGLFPYVDPESLSFRDAIAHQFHQPDNFDEVVFHREQAEVYRRLIAGDSVILSAPTSFGKSLVVDAVIAKGHLNNIVVVVPTLALIDETRRRFARFSNQYKVISNLSQKPSEKNLFVLTAERAVAIEELPKIDLFVIDEFYKIGAIEEDEARTVALNEAFYRLSKDRAQFYLLGPNIQRIPEGLEDQYRCFFYPTRFSTVAVDTLRVPGKGKDIQRLLDVLAGLDEPTLVYCNSPSRVNKIAEAMLEADILNPSGSLDDAAAWIGEEYHPDWTLPKGLPLGIGIHHGRLPRALAQFVVKAFNDGNIQFLICTSTLIEGVNTKAKNVVVWDNKIGFPQRPLDFFTFSNIKGRAGRMRQYFVGRVYVFEDPPQELLPFVDFPLFTQDENAPESLLIQLDQEDLSDQSHERMKKYTEQIVLDIDVIRGNHSTPPESQVALAQRIEQAPELMSRQLAWSGYPTYDQLKFACELIWEFLVEGNRLHGVFSGAQLAVKLMQLSETESVSNRVRNELSPGRWAAKTANEAVERVLQFERSWAGFEFPRCLRALDSIQKDVLDRLSLAFGDYSVYGALVESLFLPPVVAALDEYGIPFSVGTRIQPLLGTTDDIDVALAAIKAMDVRTLNLPPFEKQLIVDAQEGL
jgi:hypothetical protein